LWHRVESRRSFAFQRISLSDTFLYSVWRFLSRLSATGAEHVVATQGRPIGRSGVGDAPVNRYAPRRSHRYVRAGGRSHWWLVGPPLGQVSSAVPEPVRTLRVMTRTSTPRPRHLDQ